MSAIHIAASIIFYFKEWVPSPDMGAARYLHQDRYPPFRNGTPRSDFIKSYDGMLIPLDAATIKYGQGKEKRVGFFYTSVLHGISLTPRVDHTNDAFS